MGETLPIKADYIQRRAAEVDNRPLNCNIKTKKIVSAKCWEKIAVNQQFYIHKSHALYLCYSKIGSNANTSFQIKNEKSYDSHTLLKEPSQNVLQRKKLNPDKGNL